MDLTHSFLADGLFVPSYLQGIFDDLIESTYKHKDQKDVFNGLVLGTICGHCDKKSEDIDNFFSLPYRYLSFIDDIYHKQTALL